MYKKIRAAEKEKVMATCLKALKDGQKEYKI